MINFARIVILGICLVLSSALQGAEEEQQIAQVKKLVQSEEPSTLFLGEARDTIRNHVRAISDHDLNKAYYAFTSRPFRAATSREGFQRFVFENPVISQNFSLDIREPVIQDNIAIFQTIMASRDNEEKLVEFAMVVEDKQWKILGIKVYPLSK